MFLIKKMSWKYSYLTLASSEIEKCRVKTVTNLWTLTLFVKCDRRNLKIILSFDFRVILQVSNRNQEFHRILHGCYESRIFTFVIIEETVSKSFKRYNFTLIPILFHLFTESGSLMKGNIIICCPVLDDNRRCSYCYVLDWRNFCFSTLKSFDYFLWKNM